VAALLLGVAMMNVAYTMLIPLVPELTGRFGLSALGVAAAFSGFAMAKALAQPVGGVLVDRVARLSVLASVGLCVTAGAIVGLAYATAGWQVLAWRLAWGVAEGVTMPALYRLASAIGTGSGRGTTRVMGWFGAAAVSGMAAGPAIVGVLHPHLGFKGVFLAGAALTATSGGLLLSLGHVTAHEAGDEAEPVPAAAQRTTGSLAILVGLFAGVDLLNNAVYAALEPVVPLHLEDTTSADAVHTTALLFASGLVVFAVVSATCARLVETRPLLVVSGVAFWVAAAGLALAGLVDGIAVFFAGFLLFMATQPVLYVVARRGVSLLPRERLGRAYGAFGFVSDIGFIAGPLLGALLYATVEGATFVVLAAAAAAAGLGALATRRLPGRLLVTIHTAGSSAPAVHGPAADEIRHFAAQS
jgi:MFS transporter, DHA1 family, multidrug resistance protein